MSFLGPPQEFLRDLIAEKQAAHPALSIRAIAKRAGFRSPATLSMILNGQRKLTLRSAERIAVAIALRGRRRSLLLAYARQSSATTAVERAEAEDGILRIRSTIPENKLRPEQLSFLANWYYPVVYALAGGGLPAPDTLAKALGRGVRKTDVERAITDLKNLGLLREEASGRWVQTMAAITTPDEVRDFAVRKYHRNMNLLAAEALDYAVHQREFNGLTIRVAAKNLPEVKERLRQFRSELNEFLSAKEEAGDVFQFNLQLFPLTEGLEKS